jgi:hypothetical protein
MASPCGWVEGIFHTLDWGLWRKIEIFATVRYKLIIPQFLALFLKGEMHP